jgi:hypothetical protein
LRSCPSPKKRDLRGKPQSRLSTATPQKSRFPRTFSWPVLPKRLPGRIALQRARECRQPDGITGKSLDGSLFDPASAFFALAQYLHGYAGAARNGRHFRAHEIGSHARCDQVIARRQTHRHIRGARRDRVNRCASAIETSARGPRIDLSG